jgi:predicted nucleic acid-binding protein
MARGTDEGAVATAEDDAAHHPFIAAHARALDLTLATNDTAEFAPLRALTLESWTVSPAAPLE